MIETEKIGWKAASNGVAKRHWFVMHNETRRYHLNKEGRLIWFGSFRSAQRKADELNRLMSLQ
jgi:hypothetical protein